jgi:hypothetical protein
LNVAKEPISMSENITIPLTAEEKAELERLAAAHWEASLASQRAFCAIGAYSHRVIERAFSELPVPPGIATQYCLVMATLTADGSVEAVNIWEGVPPDQGIDPMKATPRDDLSPM